jgi:hypothetical protein
MYTYTWAFFNFSLETWTLVQSAASFYREYDLIKSRRMRWAEHSECVGKMNDALKIIFGIPETKVILYLSILLH